MMQSTEGIDACLSSIFHEMFRIEQHVVLIPTHQNHVKSKDDMDFTVNGG